MEDSQAIEARTPADFACPQDPLHHQLADSDHYAFVICYRCRLRVGQYCRPDYRDMAHAPTSTKGDHRLSHL